MNAFDSEVWVTFRGGPQVCFRVPDHDGRRWAVDLMNRAMAAKSWSEEETRILHEELPAKLLDHVVTAKLPNDLSLPPDWKEHLSKQGVLEGRGGLDLLNRVFFCSSVEPDGPAKA